MTPTAACDEAPATSPPDFEKDGQEFFTYFDKVQDGSDEDMIRRLKDGLDALLVYAGLFSAVNSAFLIYMLQELKPDPTDVTNELLYQLIQLTISPNQSAEIIFPSDIVTQGPGDLLVSRLFCLSLSLSLLTALFVVWGKQWLANYRSRNGAGAERWDQLNRALGAKRWKLVQTLEMVLPVTLLLSLAIFAVGLVNHIVDIEASSWAMYPLFTGAILSYVLCFARLLDPWCPYYTPINAIWLAVAQGGFWIIAAIVNAVMISSKMVIKFCNLFYVRIRGARQLRWARRARRVPRAGRGDLQTTALQIVQHSRASVHSLGTDDIEREGSRQANFRRRSGSSDNDASDRIINQMPNNGTIESILSSIKLQWRTLVWLPKPATHTRWEALHGDAIVQILNVSRDAATLYHTAASICSITNNDYLNVIFKDKYSREQLKSLFREAVRTLARLQGEGRQKKDIREIEKMVVVFGTAHFHLYFCVGSWGKLSHLPDIDFSDPDASLRHEAAKENELSCFKSDLTRFWNVQDGRLGHQPSIFTSACLAAGLLGASLDPGTSIFNETSKTLTFQLDSIASTHPGLWSQLALLVLACNSRGGGTMNGSSQDYFLEIQKAYTTTRPTKEFPEAVYQAIRGHSGEKTRLPTDIFRLAWKLFVQGRQGEGTARALGSHVPFLGILESKVRDDGKPMAYREYFQGLRSECFEVVLNTVRNIAYAERVEDSASWRFQAKFVFKAVDHYAACIMALGDPRHVENREALGFIRCIRALVPLMDPARADPAQAQSASMTEYRSEVKTFEETCEAFESFIRSGQIKRRLAPEDQWCFSQDELCFSG
ncbi:hypothetical protein M407DRAFT_21041 [Tulasnella calospora MUT 4182]|uniref:DUF6535 domain-containing protein n=1 Tax=Tulasnella calospora MUT 4182 TaxID=1051891 RepID=A0A0C3M7Y8_9AGAM|nr:hypothetical protein M407DRAFT_21041 [Tulasnella calospora MUT 4182]